MRERIEAQYSSRIKEIWVSESGCSIKTLGITVLSASSSENLGRSNDLELKQTPQLPLVSKNVKVDNPLEAALDSRFTFENFVVGKPNELAYAAAQRVAGSDEVNFNPLFLYGGVGLGKTHLMHSIASVSYTHLTLPTSDLV